VVVVKVIGFLSFVGPASASAAASQQSRTGNVRDLGKTGRMTDGTARMLALLSLLQVRREWPAAELAGRLDVSTRTIRRDIERLRELGYRVRVSMGPDGGYRLAAGEQLPPLRFDDEQAVAIAIALGSVAGTAAIEEAAERALATVRQVLPSRLRHRVDAIVFDQERSAVRTDPNVIAAVSDAVRQAQVLRFDYRGAGAEPSLVPRRVEPRDLVARDGRWYLIAFDLEAEDWRIFRLDRMHPRAPLGARFSPRPIPHGDARTYLTARFRGATENAEWPCRGEVVIQASPEELAPWLEDGDRVDAVGDRSRFVLGSWSWAGVLARLLRFERPFDIVGPPELRTAARCAAEHLAAATTRAGKLG
jgi:predicted DNA-binding transcriptional regulator YafY